MFNLEGIIHKSLLSFWVHLMAKGDEGQQGVWVGWEFWRSTRSECSDQPDQSVLEISLA